MILEQALDFQNNYEARVVEAADYIRKQLNGRTPVFGVTLGSGLGDLADNITEATEISYASIPNFPVPTVEGHEGTMLIGNLEGVPVIGLKGRKHLYEVSDQPFNMGMLQVIFPIHVLAELGVENYFVTNAAGGLNLDYNVGDIMVIGSHDGAIPDPLLGRHHNFQTLQGKRVERFQPLNDEYDPALMQMLHQAGSNHTANIHEGFYFASTGPSYETKAQCLKLRKQGFDAVGMSTVPEVIVARNRGMRAVGMSCITNKIAADGTNATDHDEVKAILASSEVRERLSSTVRQFFKLYKERHLPA